MKILLNEIIRNKFMEIAEKKKKRDFLGAIIHPKVGNISIIAEIKLSSPSAGKLGEEKELEKRVIVYEKSGADAVSLVVDQKYFDGELEFIRRIKSAVSLPVLAKDFILDPYQIYEMKAYGTDAVLLIAKIVSLVKLVQLVKLARELDLEPVVEVQNGEELQNATQTDTKIIAVNARDLDTFNVDIDRACELISSIPKKFISLGFSGVLGGREAEKYKKAGAKGVLVGTSLMKIKKAEEIIKKLMSFRA